MATFKSFIKAGIAVAIAAALMPPVATAQPGVTGSIAAREGVATVSGRMVGVEVIVRVPPGGDPESASAAAVRRAGAEPVDAGPVREDPEPTFSCGVFCFTWPQFSVAPRGREPVPISYNPSGDPTDGGGLDALRSAQMTWSGVTSSVFGFELAGTTDRCPSLIFLVCSEHGQFDDHNDVGWLPLDAETLGITVWGFDIDGERIVEADVALNSLSGIDWRTDGEPVDVETVMLHELGHVAGLGHTDDPDTVMFPFLDTTTRALTQSEIDGLTFLYPKAAHPRPTKPLKPAPPLQAREVAAVGDPAPGGGTLEIGFLIGGLNDAGTTAFGSAISDGDAVLRSESTGLVELARPGSPPGSFAPAAPSISDLGDSAFAYGPLAFPLGRDASLFRAPATGGLEALVVPGVTPAPSGGAFVGTSSGAVADGAGTAFTGITATPSGIGEGLGKGAYLAVEGQPIESVAAPGDGALGARIDYAGLPTANAVGDVAFEAHLAGDPCRAFVLRLTCRTGLGVYVRSAATASIERVAGPGDELVDRQILSSARAPVINDRGEVLFAGESSRPLGGRRLGATFLRTTEGDVRPVFVPGAEAPGGGHFDGAPLAPSSPQHALSDGGQIAFESRLREDNPVAPGSIGNSGIYAGRPGSLRLVARPGTRVIGLGTILAIDALHIDESDPDESFILPGGVGINDAGQVAFVATLTDGRIVLLQTRGRR